MLDNREAGADTRSTGLLASVNPIAATAGGGTEAIITDLANLASACAGVGGLDLLYICGPSAAVKIALLAPLLKIPVTCSAAVADDQVVCLAPGALVIGGSADPVEISVSRETVLHMEDTSPNSIDSRFCSAILRPCLYSCRTRRALRSIWVRDNHRPWAVPTRWLKVGFQIRHIDGLAKFA